MDEDANNMGGRFVIDLGTLKKAVKQNRGSLRTLMLAFMHAQKNDVGRSSELMRTGLALEKARRQLILVEDSLWGAVSVDDPDATAELIITCVHFREAVARRIERLDQ